MNKIPIYLGKSNKSNITLFQVVLAAIEADFPGVFDIRQFSGGQYDPTPLLTSKCFIGCPDMVNKGWLGFGLLGQYNSCAAANIPYYLIPVDNQPKLDTGCIHMHEVTGVFNVDNNNYIKTANYSVSDQASTLYDILTDLLNEYNQPSDNPITDNWDDSGW